MIMKESDFTRVNNDSNCKPRYVCHLFCLLRPEEQTLPNYGLAVKRANALGGKKYRGNDFVGGIVDSFFALWV